MLRLFTYINGNPEDFETRDEIAAAYKSKIISETVATTLLEKLKLRETVVKKSKLAAGESSSLLTKEGRVAASMTLLKQGFALHTRAKSKPGAMEATLQAFSFFNIQMLRRLQLIDEKVSTLRYRQ